MNTYFKIFISQELGYFYLDAFVLSFLVSPSDQSEALCKIVLLLVDLAWGHVMQVTTSTETIIPELHLVIGSYS